MLAGNITLLAKLAAGRHPAQARDGRRYARAGGPPRSRGQHVLVEPLGEDVLSAKNSITTKAPRHDNQPYRSASHRKIQEAATVSAVDPLRNPSASRAGAGCARVADRNQRAGVAKNRASATNPRGTSAEGRKPCCMAFDFPQNQGQTATKLHQK